MNSIPEPHSSRSNLRTRGAAAYEQIRAMIFTGELAAGSVVGEATLVRALNMSRTPVREAMTRLESEGHIRVVPGRGFQIIEVRATDLLDAYVVRARLEGLAAELAAGRPNRVTIARLEDIYDQIEVARRAKDDELISRLNNEFHGVIADASGNEYLRGTLQNILEVFDKFKPAAMTLPGRRDQVHREHAELIEVLRSGDVDQARSMAEAHVEHALEARRQALEALAANEHSSGHAGGVDIPATAYGFTE